MSIRLGSDCCQSSRTPIFKRYLPGKLKDIPVYHICGNCGKKCSVEIIKERK